MVAKHFFSITIPFLFFLLKTTHATQRYDERLNVTSTTNLDEDMPAPKALRTYTRGDTSSTFGSKSWYDKSDSPILWTEITVAQSIETEFYTLWRDQGWGNRKGFIWIVESDKGTTPVFSAANVVAKPSTTAEHSWKDLYLYFLTKPNKQYHLWIRVGGGGGHSLHVANGYAKKSEKCAISKAVVFSLTMDQYPQDISWSFKDKDGNVISSGSGYSTSYETYENKWCVASDGCYDFELIDSYGDGLYGQAGYSLTSDEKTVMTYNHAEDKDGKNVKFGGGSCSSNGMCSDNQLWVQHVQNTCR